MFRSTILFSLFVFSLATAQIKVTINSGDPAYPFPQFQPYVNSTGVLGNLGTHNAVGVTHAEMEKTVREAYQIMMNAATKPGGGVGGKEYIRYNSSPQCSEGDGYGLLGAVSMADKETFDGMWLYIHDFTMNKVKRYSNGQDATPGYKYCQLPGWTGTGTNSATDADVDIGLALLCAYRQWGEFMGIKDSSGNQISYKQAAIDFLKALTDTLVYAHVDTTLLSGDIGLDGYFKSGDSWAELSGFAASATQTGFSRKAEQPGPQMQYADYMAPAYFTQFADFLAATDSAAFAWNISQFRRAAASSDWIMGQLLANPKMIPCAGHVTLSSENVATFTQMNEAEDFRLAWRTILNYVWNGTPSSSWDPAKHQAVGSQPNNYERDIGLRYAKFLWDTRQAPWGNSCSKISNATFDFWGPSVLRQQYSVTGDVLGSFMLNWIPGAGSPAAVAAQDFNLMAELYRTCETTWDADKSGDGYLTSVPKYYHGWFRLLGMLVLSGNYGSPMAIVPSANMKIYCDVNKTCAVPGEEVAYTLSYRNYGSVDAQSVVIVDTIPAATTYISSSEGSSYDATHHTVTWNIGAVPGFKTATGITPTCGTVSLKVSVNDAVNTQCVNKATVKCSNGSGWTSNEYPNAVSAVMKRNFVDIIKKPVVNDNGEKELPELHGGRPGVYFSCSYGTEKSSSTMRTVRIGIYHDAQEAYIDYGNYRFSYFLYDTATECLTGLDSCTTGWATTQLITEGIDKSDVLVKHERLVSGETSGRKWNQRLIVQFANPEDPKRTEKLSTIDQYIRMYYGSPGIHRGGKEPFLLAFSVNTSTWQPVQWDDDWSWNTSATSVDNAPGYPITPDFTDPAPDNPGIPLDRIHPKSCSKADTTVDNVLVEEWDGYVWRRVFGNAPHYTVALSTPVKRSSNQLSLHQTSPTAVRFTLAYPQTIRLQLLDINGRLLATQADGIFAAGSHTVKLTNTALHPRIVLLRLVTAEGTCIKRIIRW